MSIENKEKTQNDDTSENECQTRYCGELWDGETDTEEYQESGDGEVDLVIDQNLTNLSTEAGQASPAQMS